MLAAVLDSSVLTAAFLKPDGINREVLRRAGRDYRLVLSEAILEETERVLMTYERIRSRYPCSDEDVRAFLGALRGVSRPVITAWPEVYGAGGRSGGWSGRHRLEGLPSAGAGKLPRNQDHLHSGLRADA